MGVCTDLTVTTVISKPVKMIVCNYDQNVKTNTYLTYRHALLLFFFFFPRGFLLALEAACSVKLNTAKKLIRNSSFLYVLYMFLTHHYLRRHAKSKMVAKPPRGVLSAFEGMHLDQNFIHLNSDY